MNASPPAAQGTSHISTPVDSVPHPPPPNGQDRDTMETDEDSDHYEDSEDDENDPSSEEGQEPRQVPSRVDPATPIEDVVMDTSPDHPSAPTEGAHGSATDQGSQTIPAMIPHFEVDAAGLPSMTLTDGWTIAPPGTVPSMSPDGRGQIQLHTEAELLALEEARRSGAQLDATGAATRERQDTAQQQGRGEERGDEEEDGSDSDESMDEADHPYWARFKPDTSVPDESEISAIEEGDEPSATDHAYWERSTFEPLDDPEYVSSDTGRISWLVKGNHGTPEKPNREEIMRSPSVSIGGLYWNIKYYPRGNDGTDYMSVYVECSPKPYEKSPKENEPATESMAEEKIPVEDPSSGSQAEVVGVSNAVANNAEPAVLEHASGTTSSQTPEVDMDASLVLPSKEDLSNEMVEVENELPWSAAAQVACVVYNPEEPR